MKRYYIFIAFLVLGCLIAVAAQTLTAINPARDTKISRDISNIKSSIDTYALKDNSLPNSLKDLKISDTDTATRLSDYEYRKIGYNSFDLCAVFKTDTTKRGDKSGYDSSYVDTAVHGKGHYCFSYKDYIYVRSPKPPARTSTVYSSNADSLSICGQTYNANLSADGQKLQSVDVNKNSLVVQPRTGSTSTVTQIYSLATNLKIYERSCVALKISDLKPGDSLNIYVGSGSNTATVIVRQ